MNIEPLNEKSPGEPGLLQPLKAGVPGLEPRTKESESSVLPITPNPTTPRTNPSRLVTLTYGPGVAQMQRRAYGGDVPLSGVLSRYRVGSVI